MMCSLDMLRAQREVILALGKRWGASNIRVFGSVARGDAGPQSDVDVLIELEPGRSLLDLGGFTADLQDLLGCAVDVLSERGLRPRFRERIQSQVVPL